MRNKIGLSLIIIFVSVQSSAAQEKGTFKDTRDNKIYKTVTIGKQVWMAENLAFKMSSGCWSYPADDYDNDPLGNVKIFGYLYDWEAAKKACPAGWHLPTKVELEELFQTLGGETGAAYKMKSATGWSKNGSGNNESGFNARAGGSVIVNTEYKSVRYTDVFEFGSWWTATEQNGLVWSYRMVHLSKDVYKQYEGIENGISVRCIRD